MTLRQQDTINILLLFLISIFYGMLFVQHAGYYTYDEGILMNEAAWVSDGLMPFKDFVYLITVPGHSYIISVFFLIFGKSLLAGRISVIVMLFFASGLLYLIAKKLMPGLFAFMAALFFIVLGGYSSWFFPYANWYSMPFALFAALLLLTAIEREISVGMMLLAGISSAMALLCKQNIGALNFLLIIFFELMCELVNRLSAGEGIVDKAMLSRLRRFLLYYCAGFCTVLTLFFLYLGVNGVLNSFLFYCFVYPFTYVGASAWTDMTLAVFVDEVRILLLLMAGKMGWLNIFLLSLLGVLIGASCFLRKARYSFFLLIGVFVLLFNDFVFPYYNVISYVVFCLTVLTAAIVYLTRRMMFKDADLRLLKFVFVFMLSMAFFMHVYPHWFELSHYRLAVGPLFILLVFFIYRVTCTAADEWKQNTPGKSKVNSMFVYSMAVFVLVYPVFDELNRQVGEFLHKTQKGQQYFKDSRMKVYVDKEDAGDASFDKRLTRYKETEITQVKEYLESKLGKDETFVVFPAAYVLYFMLDRRPPASIFEIAPENVPLGEKEFTSLISDLIRQKTRYCVMDEAGYISWQMPSVYPFYNFVKNNYTLEKEFGHFKVFRLKDGSFEDVADKIAAGELAVKARQSFDRGDFSETDVLLAKLLKNDPADAWAHYFRGYNIETWLMDEARKQAQQMAPQRNVAQYKFSSAFLGDIFLMRLNMPEDAVLMYEGYLSFFPDDVKVRYNMSIALKRAGYADTAEAELNKARKLSKVFAVAEMMRRVQR